MVPPCLVSLDDLWGLNFLDNQGHHFLLEVQVVHQVLLDHHHLALVGDFQELLVGLVSPMVLGSLSDQGPLLDLDNLGRQEAHLFLEIQFCLVLTFHLSVLESLDILGFLEVQCFRSHLVVPSAQGNLGHLHLPFHIGNQVTLEDQVDLEDLVHHCNLVHRYHLVSRECLEQGYHLEDLASLDDPEVHHDLDLLEVLLILDIPVILFLFPVILFHPCSQVGREVRVMGTEQCLVFQVGP